MKDRKTNGHHKTHMSEARGINRKVTKRRGDADDFEIYVNDGHFVQVASSSVHEIQRKDARRRQEDTESPKYISDSMYTISREARRVASGSEEGETRRSRALGEN